MKCWSIFAALLTIAFVGASDAQAESALREDGRIPLVQVAGRIDHLSVDLVHGRLFIAALGNHTVEVVDLRAARVVRTLPGFVEPQGVLAIPGSDQLLVTDGDSDHGALLNTQTWQPVARIALPEDSDNVRFDRRTGHAWIGAGTAQHGALVAVDPRTAQVIGEIKLRGHPESFQLEAGGPLIYVNVPTAGLIAVADRDKGTVVTDWIVPAAGNFPMALDEASGRLFVATRHPARLLVFDTATGKVVVNIKTVRDADDVFFDGDTHRVYVSGGEGFVHVYQEDEVDHLSLSERVRTRAGARTSLFVPEWRLFFVAVPRQGNASAEIRVFKVAAAQPQHGSAPGKAAGSLEAR